MRVVEEIGEHGALVTFAAETGLRPCEWLALERREVDKAGRVVYVEREHVGGETKPYGKTAASRRRVPLTARALDAIEHLAPRLDSPLVFPAVRGGYLNLRNWRAREWDTAVESAGLAVCKCGHLSGAHDHTCTARGCRCETFERSVLSPVPYVLRHTFASNALAAGVGTFELARVMRNLARDDRAHLRAPRARSRRVPIAARRVRDNSGCEKGARAVNDQIDSRSAVAAACRRSLTSASSRAARSMRSCCICARACWLSTSSCWLSARACWRSARSVIALRSFAIASTVRVSSANWPATLAMSSRVVTFAGFYDLMRQVGTARSCECLRGGRRAPRVGVELASASEGDSG